MANALRREVRRFLGRYGYPLPVKVLADLALRFAETPYVVDIVAKVDAVYTQKKLKWEPWEIAFLKGNAHLPDRELARALSREVQSVRGKRIALGLKKHARGGTERSGASLV